MESRNRNYEHVLANLQMRTLKQSHYHNVGRLLVILSNKRLRTALRPASWECESVLWMSRRCDWCPTVAAFVNISNTSQHVLLAEGDTTGHYDGNQLFGYLLAGTLHFAEHFPRAPELWKSIGNRALKRCHRLIEIYPSYASLCPLSHEIRQRINFSQPLHALKDLGLDGS